MVETVDAPWQPRRKIVLFVTIVAALSTSLLLISLHDTPQTPSIDLPPLPFGSSVSPRSSLAGALTEIGQQSSVDVYNVTLTNGEIQEDFYPDRIYLVHIPSDESIINAPLDHVFRARVNGGRNVNFYGYMYTDASASAERRDAFATRFSDRFSGRFFASMAARDSDAENGESLENFERDMEIAFLPTDASPDAPRLSSAGSLFVFVVNEPEGATFTPRDRGICGNGVPEGEEECDDGNTDDTDACTNACILTLCGDGVMQASEQCDDGNTVDDDSCDNSCTLVAVPF